MIAPPPPEDEAPADLEDGEAGASIPGQLSILDLLDEIAASMGIPGWEAQHVERQRRARRQRA